jgi:hypothetical protein
MSEARATSALVEQFRRGGIARDLRLMAAQGLLPLKSEDLIELWVDLERDPDEGVRAATAKSLSSFPAVEFLPIVKSRSTPASVLAWTLTNRPERELREAALQNTSTADDTIEALAPSLSTELAELVVINQVRLLRRLSLLEAIERNPSLSNDQKRRLRELRETFRIGEVAAPTPPPTAAPPPPPQAPVEIQEAPPEPVSAADTLEKTFPTVADVVVNILSEEEQQQAEKVSTIQKIYRLTTAEKLITALKGTREERAILIRDPNRLVTAAVMDSPRLTEPEIESISAMKNVSDQVLRHIGNHREWTKRYAVVSNLVKNPRTPLAISLRLVSNLNPRDMKSVSVDRNVPEAVRKAVQKFVKQPEKR